MKFKIKVTGGAEYKVTKKDLVNLYGGVKTFEEAMEIDLENFRDDPYTFLDTADGESRLEFDGEVIK